MELAAPLLIIALFTCVFVSCLDKCGHKSQKEKTALETINNGETK